MVRWFNTEWLPWYNASIFMPKTYRNVARDYRGNFKWTVALLSRNTWRMASFLPSDNPSITRLSKARKANKISQILLTTHDLAKLSHKVKEEKRMMYRRPFEAVLARVLSGKYCILIGSKYPFSLVNVLNTLFSLVNVPNTLFSLVNTFQTCVFLTC